MKTNGPCVRLFVCSCGLSVEHMTHDDECQTRPGTGTLEPDSIFDILDFGIILYVKCV